ncbi:hypothetical protein M15_04340 [Atrimonas thermophila]
MYQSFFVHPSLRAATYVITSPPLSQAGFWSYFGVLQLPGLYAIMKWAYFEYLGER